MYRIFASLILFCTTLVVSSQSISAQPVTVPAGLAPGEQYRLAFVTSTTTYASASNIHYYNNFVNNLANTAGSPLDGLSTWTAIGSTDSIAARDNTLTHPGVNPDYPIYNLAGDLVASNNAALWNTASVALANPIDIFESGLLAPPNTYVWTGTLSDGTPNSLGGGALGDGSGFARDGSTTGGISASDGWIYYGYDGQLIHEFSMYAMSGVLTVPTPEPSSIVLAGLAAAGLAVAAIRKRRIASH